MGWKFPSSDCREQAICGGPPQHQPGRQGGSQTRDVASGPAGESLPVQAAPWWAGTGRAPWLAASTWGQGVQRNILSKLESQLNPESCQDSGRQSALCCVTIDAEQALRALASAWWLPRCPSFASLCPVRRALWELWDRRTWPGGPGRAGSERQCHQLAVGPAADTQCGYKALSFFF